MYSALKKYQTWILCTMFVVHSSKPLWRCSNILQTRVWQTHHFHNVHTYRLTIPYYIIFILYLYCNCISCTRLRSTYCTKRLPIFATRDISYRMYDSTRLAASLRTHFRNNKFSYRGWHRRQTTATSFSLQPYVHFVVEYIAENRKYIY